jgi:aminoglycoside phosphotransferase (APT) family kinase protein
LPILPEPSDEAVRSAVARLAGTRPFTFSRAASGTTTPVYRVDRGTETLYLRVAEDAKAELAPELHVHRAALERGCQVPTVFAYARMDPDIGRSVALLGEIAGEAVGWQPSLDRDQLASVLRAAGRDLAAVNSIEVNGFGWIRRDLGARPLQAEHSTFADWIGADTEEGVEKCLEALADHLTEADRAGIRATARALVEDDELGPALVHGDFDVTHIVHDRGRYTGLIDFGEIRGAEPWYDLSLFWRLHGGFDTGAFMYARLLEGYFGGQQRLDFDRVRRTALMIALRFAARRTVRQGHDWLRQHPDVGGLTQIRALAHELMSSRTRGRGSVPSTPIHRGGDRTMRLPWMDGVRDWANRRGATPVHLEVAGQSVLRGGTYSTEVIRFDLRASASDGTDEILPVVFKRTSVVGAGLDAGAGDEVLALRSLQKLRGRSSVLPELIVDGLDERGPWAVMPFYPGVHPGHDRVPFAVLQALAEMHVAFLNREDELVGLEPTDHRYWRSVCLEVMTTYVEQSRTVEPHPLLDRAQHALQHRADDERFLEALELLPKTLVHADVWAGNILGASSGATLVDWGSARIAPAMLHLPSVTEPGLPAFTYYLSSWERISGAPHDPWQAEVGFLWATVYRATLYIRNALGDWPRLAATLDRADSALAQLGETLTARTPREATT